MKEIGFIGKDVECRIFRSISGTYRSRLERTEIGMGLQARDPNYALRVRESFNCQGFMHHLGVRMNDVEPGYVELEVEFDDALSQHHGYFHGAVVAALADVASGYAAISLMDPDSSGVTVEFKLNLFTVADGEHLVARASVLKPGKTLTVCQSNVFSVTGGSETLCATALGTFMALPGKAELEK